MNRTLLTLIAAVTLVHADSSDEPGSHFFTVPSPGNKFHAVHTVRRWAGIEKPEQYARIQVFETESGREAWRLDGVMASEGELFPADDGVHLVLLARSIWGVGRAIKRNLPVVQFYERGQPMKSYSLEDLKIDTD